jgi:hypothetical protein
LILSCTSFSTYTTIAAVGICKFDIPSLVEDFASLTCTCPNNCCSNWNEECRDQDGFENEHVSRATKPKSPNHQTLTIHNKATGKHKREASDDEQDGREGEDPKRPRHGLLFEKEASSA